MRSMEAATTMAPRTRVSQRARLLTLAVLVPLSAGCLANEVAIEGPVIQIPRMQEEPTFDKRMAPGEWRQTAELAGTFVIADGSRADGTYPFRLRVGATDDGLLIAAEIRNGTENPFNTEDARWADALYVFFKTDEDSGLTRPSFMLAGFTEGASTWTASGFWNGREWERDPTDDGGEMGPDFRPRNGTWVRAGAGQGTTVFEIFTPRIPNHSIRNSLHLTPGAEFRMGLAYMRGAGVEEENRSRDGRGPFHWPHDAWPGEGYTPHGMYEPDDWMRFRMP
jgi:hypothetical protein